MKSELGELIQVLTPHEKRIVSSKIAVYQKKQAVLKKYFAHFFSPHAMPPQRIYFYDKWLKEKILSILGEIYSSHYLENYLQQEIQKCHVYLSKRKYTHAGKKARDLLEIITTSGHIEYTPQVFTILHNVATRTYTQIDPSTLKLINSCLQKLQHEMELATEIEQCSALISKKGFKNNPPLARFIRQKMADLKKIRPHSLSPRGIYYYYYLHTLYFYLFHRHDPRFRKYILKNYTLTKSLFLRKNKISLEFFHYYIAAYNNLIVLLQEEKKYNQALQIGYQFLKDIHTLYLPYEEELKYYQYKFILGLLVEKEDYTSALPWAKKIEEINKTTELPERNIISLHFYLAWVYFLNHHIHKANQYVQKILSEKEKNINKDILLHTRILQLFIFYVKKDHALAESFYRSFYRKYQRQKGALASLYIDFLRILIKAPHKNRVKKESKTFLQKLKQFEPTTSSEWVKLIQNGVLTLLRI